MPVIEKCACAIELLAANSERDKNKGVKSNAGKPFSNGRKLSGAELIENPFKALS